MAEASKPQAGENEWEPDDPLHAAPRNLYGPARKIASNDDKPRVIIDVDSAEGLSSSSTRTGRFVDRSRHRRRVAGTPTKTKPPSVNDLEALWRPSATQEVCKLLEALHPSDLTACELLDLLAMLRSARERCNHSEPVGRSGQPTLLRPKSARRSGQ
jgi:hypothetical protein